MTTYNRNRVRVRLAISIAPGIHLRELQRQLSLSFSTVRYHCARLVLDGEVEAYTHNGYQRLFPKDFPPSWRMVVSALRGASALRVMNEIHKGPRTINDLSEATGLAKSTVSKQIQKLRSLGIAIPISYSGRTHYSPSGDRKITDLVTIGKKGLNSAVDHYLEMWEF